MEGVIVVTPSVKLRTMAALNVRYLKKETEDGTNHIVCHTFRAGGMVCSGSESASTSIGGPTQLSIEAASLCNA